MELTCRHMCIATGRDDRVYRTSIDLCRICDIYDFFAPHINVLTYLLYFYHYSEMRQWETTDWVMTYCCIATLLRSFSTIICTEENIIYPHSDCRPMYVYTQRLQHVMLTAQTSLIYCCNWRSFSTEGQLCWPVWTFIVSVTYKYRFYLLITITSQF